MVAPRGCCYNPLVLTYLALRKHRFRLWSLSADEGAIIDVLHLARTRFISLTLCSNPLVYMMACRSWRDSVSMTFIEFLREHGVLLRRHILVLSLLCNADSEVIQNQKIWNVVSQTSVPDTILFPWMFGKLSICSGFAGSDAGPTTHMAFLTLCKRFHQEFREAQVLSQISDIGKAASQVGDVALIHVEAQDSVYVYIQKKNMRSEQLEYR